ncbi:MAG: XRE family transcriptional regulator, partial [Gammaproteobacteria bacterium]
PMAKSFNKLRQKLPLRAQQLAAKKTKTMIDAMPLQELRQAIHISQEQLAIRLATKQANISRLERRTDMYISTLRTYIEAMGGQLDIVARFPEGDVHITQFKEV